VAEFLGVLPGPGCFVICATCAQDPSSLTPTKLILPNGQPGENWRRYETRSAPAPLNADEPEWIVQVCYEMEAPPIGGVVGADQFWSAPNYLGSVLTGNGPAAVYVRRA
jgi:hypothetical protein